METQKIRPGSIDVILIASCLSAPIIGSPLMFAISVYFISGTMIKSKTKIADAITLLGFVVAYHLALALLFAGLGGMIIVPGKYSHARTPVVD